MEGLDRYLTNEPNTHDDGSVLNLMQGDCIKLMNEIPSNSVDMILADLPYGTTKNPWDATIPFIRLWQHYERIIKDNGAIVLTASQPFTTDVINSNRRLFRYELIWEKQKGSDPLNAKRKPLKSHENILVFYKKQPTYNPQFEEGEPYAGRIDKSVKSSNFNKAEKVKGDGSDGRRYPKTVLKISNEGMNSKNLHPTQKPLRLIEWLVKTFTNEGDTVLDNCMGSGTTGVACINTGRLFIGIEMNEKYFEVAQKRLSQIADEGSKGKRGGFLKLFGDEVQ